MARDVNTGEEAAREAAGARPAAPGTAPGGRAARRSGTGEQPAQEDATAEPAVRKQTAAERGPRQETATAAPAEAPGGLEPTTSPPAGGAALAALAGVAQVLLAHPG